MEMEEMNWEKKEELAKILTKILKAITLYNKVDEFEKGEKEALLLSNLAWKRFFLMKILSEQQEKENLKPEYKIESKYLFGNILEEVEESLIMSKLIKEKEPIDIVDIFSDRLDQGYNQAYKYDCYLWTLYTMEDKILNIVKYINRIKFLKILKINQISKRDLLDVIYILYDYICDSENENYYNH